MTDGCGRTIDYLRLSVTDRCNYRCRYCMPEEGVYKRDHRDMLTLEELARCQLTDYTSSWLAAEASFCSPVSPPPLMAW